MEVEDEQPLMAVAEELVEKVRDVIVALSTC